MSIKLKIPAYNELDFIKHQLKESINYMITTIFKKITIQINNLHGEYVTFMKKHRRVPLLQSTIVSDFFFSNSSVSCAAVTSLAFDTIEMISKENIAYIEIINTIFSIIPYNMIKMRKKMSDLKNEFTQVLINLQNFLYTTYSDYNVFKFITSEHFKVQDKNIELFPDTYATIIYNTVLSYSYI